MMLIIASGRLHVVAVAVAVAAAVAHCGGSLIRAAVAPLNEHDSGGSGSGAGAYHSLSQRARLVFIVRPA